MFTNLFASMLFPSCWLTWWSKPGTIRLPAPLGRVRSRNRLGLEALEDRVVMDATMSMTFCGLEFMTTGTFSTSNHVVTSSDAVQVGVAPAKGGTFTPVLQLDDGISYTDNDTKGTFTTTGTVSGLAGDKTLKLLDDQMHTFTAPGLLFSSSYFTLSAKDANMPHLDLGGGELAVTALHLTGSELDLQGTITVSGLSSLTTTVGGSTHVVLDDSGVNLSGPDPTIAGPTQFTKDGLTISVSNLDFHNDQANNEFDISGQASITISGNTLSLTLGNTTTPGLVIQNGDLQSLLATVTPPKGHTDTPFKIGGMTFALNSATFSYDQATSSFGIGADATVTLAGQTIDVTLGSEAMPGIIIQNGAFASFDGSITTDIKIDGVTLKTEDLAVQYTTLDPTNPDVSITGKASLEFDVKGNSQKLEIVLGSTAADGTSNPGILIDPSTGILMSLDAGITTDITVSGLTFKAKDLAVQYAQGADVTITGSASFDLQNEGSSTPDQMVSVMLGSTDNDGTIHPGIDIDGNGNLVSLDAAITTDITLAGLEIKADGLGIMYQSAGSSVDGVIVQQDQFVIFGSASFTLMGQTVSVTLGGGISPGMVISGGQLQSLEASVTGGFDLMGIHIDATNLDVAYVAPINGNLEQIAISGAVSVSSKFVNFTATLDGGMDPGIDIVDGQLQELHITVDGGFSLFGINVAANGLMIEYNGSAVTGGDPMLELSGGVMIDFTKGIDVGASIKQGGLLIDPTTGALTLDTSHGLEITASFTIGGFGLEGLDIAYSNGPNGVNFHASGSVILPGGYSVNLIKLDIVDGQFADIGIGYTGSLPIGDTGAFLTSLSGELDNLNDPSQLVVSASASVSFGEQVTILGHSYALATVSGSFTISAQELIISGGVSLVGGILGDGMATPRSELGHRDLQDFRRSPGHL